jgi:arsenite-transporting ATPase
VDRDGAEYLLRLPLPFADRADVGLARAGDDLAVTVAGLRRLLPLPSGLRRCQALGAQLRDGELRVRFRPDPKLWPRMAVPPGETAQPRENLPRENG